MNKTLHVAVREFVSTVGTKGFILGVLVTPLILGMLLTAWPVLLKRMTKPPKIEGQLAVVDPTGQIAGNLRELLAPAAIAERRAAFLERVLRETPKEVPGGEQMAERAAPMIETALGEVPQIHVVEVAAGADLEAEKARLWQDGDRLALAVIEPDAVVRAPGAERQGTYALYVRAKVDERIEEEIGDAVRQALIDARGRARQLDREAIQALTRIPRVRSITITQEGEQETSRAARQFIPMGYLLLLFVSVLTSGQYLMTTTIEEKSNRVVEVLLSALSPMQLMVGKILGQMGVGLVILVLYAGLGVAALVSFTLLGLIEVSLLVYTILFFVIAYFTVAALMAAIGASVNELREAQSLQTPVMLVLMLPWILWWYIPRDPNSLFSVAISFLPPINTFAMLLRLTSSSPPPAWQVWLSIAVGALGVWAALWFAAKVFRIGLLMYGKPPNFATLVRWVRMA